MVAKGFWPLEVGGDRPPAVGGWRLEAVLRGWTKDEGRGKMDEKSGIKKDPNRERIDIETFHSLDDSYEHIFAMLNAMEKKADSFCPPSS